MTYRACTLGTTPPPKFEEKAEEEAWYKKHPLPKIYAGNEEKWEMVFTGCSFKEPITCKIASQLNARNGNGTLLEEGAGVYDGFGTSTQEFLVYNVSGCTEGPFTIKGAPRCKIASPNTESVVKQCEFSATSGSTLTGGLKAVTFTATINVELAGVNKGAAWTAKE